MKKINVLHPGIAAILLLCAVSCQGQNTEIGSKTIKATTTGTGMNVQHGIFNVLIGKNAGKYMTAESYCVIVGHDSIHLNAKGRDMIWIVDWDEPYLCTHPDIKKILCDYYNDFIVTGKDDKHYRSGMILRIINRNTVSIGKDARVLQ